MFQLSPCHVWIQPLSGTVSLALVLKFFHWGKVCMGACCGFCQIWTCLFLGLRVWDQSWGFVLRQGVHGGLLWFFVFILRLTCPQAGLQLAPVVRIALNSPSSCLSPRGAGNSGVHHHLNDTRDLLDRRLPNPSYIPSSAAAVVEARAGWECQSVWAPEGYITEQRRDYQLPVTLQFTF